MPSKSCCGSIRGDLCIDVGRNICHGSDSVESAQAEIKLWFGTDVSFYQHHSAPWVYEKSAEPVFLGMGNPLLDISAVVPMEEITKWGVKAGTQDLAKPMHAPMYADLVKNYPVEYIAGGATQNSIRIAATLLGGSNQCAYIGCIGKDAFGQQLKDACTAAKVKALYLEDPKVQTGTCAVLINDKERTLIANLAAANCYSPDAHFERYDVKAAIATSKYYYCSGFFITVSTKAMQTVASQASAKGKSFGINLAAPFLVQNSPWGPGSPEFLNMMLELMPFCDYVFGNEVEAAAFAESNNLADKSCAGVAKHISGMAKANGNPRTCIITQGAESTLVSVGGAAVQTFAVPKLASNLIIDTNGAGDSFVGGFYCRLIQGRDLLACVNAGHAAAGLCIQQSGCKLPKNAVEIVNKA